MFRECPHCHIRVWPNADGICPSCQRDVFDLKDVDPDKSSLVIRRSSRMPEVCIDCGLPTSRLTKIVSYGSRTVQGMMIPEEGWMSLAVVMALFLGWIVVPFRLLRGVDPRARGRVSVKLKLRVPQCKSCSIHKIEPLYVNWESATVKFVVHKRFKSRFLDLNPP